MHVHWVTFVPVQFVIHLVMDQSAITRRSQKSLMLIIAIAFAHLVVLIVTLLNVDGFLWTKALLWSQVFLHTIPAVFCNSKLLLYN